MAARTRSLTLALLAALAVIAVWNALHYPPGLGYDAIDHIAYAEGIRAGDGFPTGSASTTRRPASTRSRPARWSSATGSGSATRAGWLS